MQWQEASEGDQDIQDTFDVKRGLCVLLQLGCVDWVGLGCSGCSGCGLEKSQ